MDLHTRFLNTVQLAGLCISEAPDFVGAHPKRQTLTEMYKIIESSLLTVCGFRDQ